VPAAIAPSDGGRKTIWEVDDDNDNVVVWDEFRTMFFRAQRDETGCEPRRLFRLALFTMLDKNHTGVADLDETLAFLSTRFGRDVVEAQARAAHAPHGPHGPHEHPACASPTARACASAYMRRARLCAPRSRHVSLRSRHAAPYHVWQFAAMKKDAHPSLPAGQEKSVRAHAAEHRHLACSHSDRLAPYRLSGYFRLRRP